MYFKESSYFNRTRLVALADVGVPVNLEGAWKAKIKLSPKGSLKQVESLLSTQKKDFLIKGWLASFKGDITRRPKANKLGHRSPTKFYNLGDHFIRDLLYRFVSNLLGSSLVIYLARDVSITFHQQELTLIHLYQQRIQTQIPVNQRNLFQYERYPWRAGALALFLAIRLKDVNLLISWVQNRMRVVSMFTHKKFFRFLGILLQSVMLQHHRQLGLRGYSLRLVGKISAVGNAMTRAYRSTGGVRGNSNLALRATSASVIVRSKSGCLGLTLSFFF